MITEAPGDNSLLIVGPDIDGAASVILDPQRHDRPYRVVVLLHAGAEPRTIDAFRASADAFLLASISAELLIKSLDLVMEGVLLMPSALTAMTNLRSGHLSSRDPAPPEPDTAQVNGMSERELLVLRCLMAGASNKTIARDLNIAEATVKVHVKSIFRKACLRNRTQVALWATQRNLDGGRALAS